MIMAPSASRGFTWPEGKKFAFTVFDDTDNMTLANGVPIYDFLADLGFRTTKSVWPLDPPTGRREDWGATCQEREYLDWTKRLKESGFEIGLHGVTSATVRREQWLAGFEAFRDFFGDYPSTHANHAGCLDSIYWGDQRVSSGINRLIYDFLTGFKRRGFHGHLADSESFWGDLCQTHLRYVRNFVFGDVNTLKLCPMMPYHDPERPFVNGWFASSEGASVRTFNNMLSEANQDQLEREGGACIMYTHFSNGFTESGRINYRFASLMRRLSRRPGWFVPVKDLLDFLAASNGGCQVISARERRWMERKWILHKLRVRGTT